MFSQHTNLIEFLDETPEYLGDIERLYQIHINYGEQRQANSPFFAFLYLINYPDSELPYDYVPNQQLGYLELDLLGAGLVAYALNAEIAHKWLDRLFDLILLDDLIESNLSD